MASFKHKPSEPSNENANKAFTILNNARKVAESFLKRFNDSRRMTPKKGVTTDDEQDLLRAMFAFASAGLDAMVKQLIRDALPIVIQNSEGSHLQFAKFVEGKLRREDKPYAFVAKIVTDKNPRQQLVEEWVYELNSNSMQSFEQICTAAAAFDIPSAEIAHGDSIKTIKNAFLMRNQIVHEMDVDLDSKNRKRRQRSKQSMIDATDVLFDVSKRFLEKVDSKLKD